MAIPLKVFLGHYQLEATEMLEKLMDSFEQDTSIAEELKIKTASLHVKSFDFSTLFLFWGALCQNDQEEKSQHVIYQALLLYAANINSPESQICYGALELYQLLEKQNNIKVYLQTMENTFFTAVLIDTGDAHYIYDPIQDPLVLFSEDEYRAQASELPLLINHPMLLAYEALKDKFVNWFELSPPTQSFKKQK